MLVLYLKKRVFSILPSGSVEDETLACRFMARLTNHYSTEATDGHRQVVILMDVLVHVIIYGIGLPHTRKIASISSPTLTMRKPE